MYHDSTFPPPDSGRLAQFMRLVEAFERDEIEASVDLLIALLDAADGDPDLEDDDSDRCSGGEDHMIAGPVSQRAFWQRYDRHTGAMPGDEADAENRCPPAWQIDQSADLFVTAANDWPEVA